MSLAGPPHADATRHAAERVARDSYGKLVAYLAARTRDVAGAEDALAEAIAAALADWPLQGVPRSPEGWLLTVARRRLVDAARRRRLDAEAAATLETVADWACDDPTLRPEIPDHRLALMFACAHPAIDAGVHAPLMLQALLGFDAATIASAFLVAPATMGQRLVRAKARIREAGIALRVPDLAEATDRLDSVLDAIYAAFAEGWSDPVGADAKRRNLADETIWLGRLLASLLPDEPEALGLLALMLFAQARRDARRDTEGRYVPLAEQDPADWDAAMVDEAEALLRRAALARRPGRFQLEAAVQSAHAAGRRRGRTDWPAIEQLYTLLAGLTASPVVRLNLAVAQSHTRGPVFALDRLDDLAGGARLGDYQPYWAARAEMLRRLGRRTEADAAYGRAIGLESDPAVRAFLQQRRAAAAAPD